MVSIESRLRIGEVSVGHTSALASYLVLNAIMTIVLYERSRGINLCFAASIFCISLKEELSGLCGVEAIAVIEQVNAEGSPAERR